ncbi:MAG: hypothetical protein ACREBI_07805 [Nitrosotalea sp.]
MKTIHLAIIVVAVGILIASSLQNVSATPYLSPQDLYSQSDMVFYGQVISKQAGPGPDYYYYQVKIETYFKNQQTSDSITMAGHKPSGGHMAYLQFEVGDKAIFYVNKLDGINTISPYSQIAGPACDVQSFLESSQISDKPIIEPAPGNHIYIEDASGNMPYIPLTNNTAVFHDDDVWNNYPQPRTVKVALSIQNEDTGQQVFNKTQNLYMQACSGPGKIEWNFVPTQIANYVATVSDDKSNISMSFNSIYNAVASKPQFILSPLKQFKSGILPENIQCTPNLALVFEAKDGTPACVRYTTANILIERGWAKKTVLDKTDSGTTVEIPVNSSIASNGFTFTPSTVNTVIGTNNTVRWISLDSVANDVTSDTNFFKSGLIESGYAWIHTFDKPGTYGYHSVIHPWLKGMVIVTSNPLINLKSDTGIITLGNQTYYFETPNYTNDAYSHQPQISFHDVVFTLFPSGFKGGLPTSCGETYYWTDVRFSDNASELLHIFAGPKCPVPPLPTYFSNHTNPQAGLTFYDGKMKLLVSTVVPNSSGR